MSPLAMAAAATLAFALPSFVRFEPRVADESVGFLFPLLAVCGIGVVSAGIWKSTAALRRISKTLAQWATGAQVLSCRPDEFDSSVFVLRTPAPAPPLTAAGILRPSVWLSIAAEPLLSDSEWQIALRHELVHVRRHDNLRKLFLRFVAAPGMAELESAWHEATEMAADDGAVSSASEALDLAAAVIKLSRLNPLPPPMELATSFVQSPAEAVNARVTRLLTWSESRRRPPRAYAREYVLCAAATLATLVLAYSNLLVRVHAATEWLVR
jgi:beta-lactamase regulating signal transducer with metallopeptidase domain